MEQRVTVKRLIIVVRSHNCRCQAARAERDAVDERKLEGPGLARGRVEPFRCAAKPEVKFHGRRAGCGLGRRLAEEFPARGPREAVLDEFRRLGMVRGWGAEHLYCCQHSPAEVPTPWVGMNKRGEEKKNIQGKPTESHPSQPYSRPAWPPHSARAFLGLRRPSS